MIHTLLLLFFLLSDQAIGHHDMVREVSRQDKTISKIKNCCVNGNYDIERQKCIGQNEKIYKFTMLCKELIPLTTLGLQDNPEEIDNACVADIYSTKNNPPVKEYFLCHEFERCCARGRFNPNTTTCIGATTAKYTFSLNCRKFTPDEDITIQSSSLTEEDRVCVEKIHDLFDDETTTSEAYLTCEKINLELALTFEMWLYPISIVFLILTLYIYLTELKQLRSSQDICFMYAITCLTLHMILHMSRYTSDNTRIIIFYNYVGRYLKTSYFSWFNVMIISRIFENLNINNHYLCTYTTRHIWYHIYAWTVPMLFIFYYLYNPHLNWHIPILILWIVNFFLLIVAIMSLRYEKDSRSETLIWKRNYYRSWLLVRLFLGAGILWVFGASYRIPIFTSLFALQGILVFLVMVIYRYSAKRMLGGVKCGCFTFPNRWRNVPIYDDDDPNGTIFLNC